MANGGTKVQTDSLVNAAAKMDEAAKKMDSETIKGILEKVKASADQQFKGEAKKAFDEVYTQDKEKIVNGAQLLQEYATLLKSLAADYETADKTAAGAIRKAGGG